MPPNPNPNPNCSRRRIRKEVRDLTNAEWNDFVNGVRTLIRDGTHARFTNIHANNFGPKHNAPMFLPYHRRFLYEYESALLRVSPNLPGLPYWDWSLDAAAPLQSVVMTERYFGSSRPGGCIPDGPFAGLSVGGQCITRGFDVRTTTNQFLSTSMLGQIVRGRYNSFDEFRFRLEGTPHNPPHNTIGGDMAGPASPRDPIFYMHHGKFCKENDLLPDREMH